MKNLDEIRTVLRTHADTLKRKYGIANLAVFGSVARGSAQEGSDVDILADIVRPIGLLELAGAENYLIDLLNCEIDLIPRRSVRPELRDEILAEAVPV